MNVHAFTISHTQAGNIFGMSSTGKGEASAQEKQLQEDFEHTEMKINDAYISNTRHITVEDNPAYGQHTPHISTEDNVAYGQMAPQIPMEDNQAYGQNSPQISTKDNVEYGQMAPQIPMEDDTEYAVIDNFGDLTSRQDQYDYEEI